MVILITLLVLIQQMISAEVVTTVDLNLGSSLSLQRNTSVEILDYRLNNFYQLFVDKKSIGYVSEQCVEIKNTVLVLMNDCPLFISIEENYSSKPDKLLKQKTKYEFYAFHRRTEAKIIAENAEYWIPIGVLKFEYSNNVEKDSYELVPVSTVMKIKNENVYLSQVIDKSIYVSTEQGVFVSFGGKLWYRLKKLEKRKYEINITFKGYLIADNLLSKDYGKSFTEFFPSYAFPYQDGFIKSIMVSPQGKDSIYLTFSSYSNPNSITLFVMNSVEEGWKRIYPTIGDEIFIVPVEDTMTSILRYVNKWINTNKHPYKGKIELEDISIQGEKNIRTATLLLKVINKTTIQRFHTLLRLSFKNDKGWLVEDEQWRFL